MSTAIEPPMEVTKPIGTIHPQNALIMLTEHCGTAKDEQYDWDLSLGCLSRSPVIYCNKTKRYWSLSWQEICELAQAAGLGKGD
jgi:hypothetical protein